MAKWGGGGGNSSSGGSSGGGGKWGGGGASSGAHAVSGGGHSDGGGGGFFGGVGRFFNEASAAVEGIPSGILRSAKTTAPMWLHAIQGDFDYFKKESNVPDIAALVHGMEQTGEHIANPGSILHDYAAHPFAAPLNDIGNVSLVAAPIAGAAGRVAGAAAEGSTLASTAERVAQVAGAVRDAPALPFRGGRSVLTGAAERAIESGTETPSFLARLGAKLTPEYQGLIGTKLEGDAQVRAVSKIVNAATDNESAIAGLRRAGYHDSADAIDALRHTAAPPPVMSENFAKVQAERAAPMPKAGPSFEAPSEMVTGKEVATALHRAGEHKLGNDFMGRGMSAAEFPRADIVAKLGESGQAKAADILAAKVPKAPTGGDVLSGLREFRTEKLTGIPAGEAPPSAPKRPSLAEPTDVPVEIPKDEAVREAVGAVRSITGSKLSGLPGVRPDYEPGLRSLEKTTNETLPTEGYLPKVLADKLAPRFGTSAKVTDSTLLHALDPANHVYAQARLNLSPATLTGRLFGHTSLSAFGAPHPLGSLMEALRVFRGKISPESEQILAEAPARLEKGGAIPTFQRELAGDVARPGAVARTVSKLDQLANKSPITRWAAKMDDALRKGIYLAERKGGAGAEDALRTVNRVAGEFDALSPAEQAIGRRLAPFYNWHKQIALIAEHLAEDHPARAVLLAKIGSNEDEIGKKLGTPGEVDIAGHAISPGFLVPFGEAGSTLKNLGTPMLGPIPKAVYGLTGQNPNTGKPFTGPDRAKGADYRYEGIAQNLRKAFPQVNILDAITGRDQYVRYNDGSRVIKNHQPIATNSDWVDTLSSFAGLRSENTAQAQSRSAAIAKSAATPMGTTSSSTRARSTRSKKSSKWGKGK